MKPTPLPINELQRLEVLRNYLVMDTPEEKALDDLTKLAAAICETPIALISLLDEHRQWFKAKVGLDWVEATREGSFCAHALLQRDLFIVPDAAKDARFAENPLITGEPRIRFYAGAPLVTPEGETLGALCVMDRVPRTLTLMQEETLLLLSRQVMTQFELRRQSGELRASEGKLRAILEAEPECVKLMSRDATLYEINAAGLRLLEADSLDAVAGRSLLPVVVPEDREAVREMLAAVAHGETRTIQFRIVGLKGTSRWLEMSGAPFLDETTGRNLVVAHSHDITERKRVEEKIQRLNRLYAVSSSINEAIVRIADTPKLYEQACRIAVEQGGLIMAWVGLTEPENGLLRPVTRWGRDEGYLDSIQVVATPDRPEGLGPAGVAYRTGMPACCNDIEADRELFASRVEALKRGYRSCAAFPLKLEGRPVGVLVVYGDHPNYFDREELQVLNALAENISFAIESHHREQRRVAAETEIRRATNLLKAVADGTPDGVFVKDLQGRYLLFNEAASRFVGRPVGEVLGRDDAAFFSPEEARGVMESDRQVLESGEAQTAEEVLTSAGVTRTYQAIKAPYRDGRGNLIGIVGISRDITERKKAEEALRASEGRYRTLFEYAPDGIVIADSESYYIDANASALRMLGYTRGEFIGLHASDIVAPAEIGHIGPALDAIKAGSDYHREWQFRRKDGSVFAAEVIATMMPDRNLMGMFRDVTERRKLEQQFLRAQRMESIGTLAGGIAHDLNNVLSPIMMSLAVLQIKFPDPDSKGLLEILSSSAQRGADMVRQVLSFARGVEGRRMEVQVKHLVSDIEKIARDTFSKNIELRTDIPRELWTVVADATQLHQVLLNLCVNARDAMPDGGALTISASNLTLDEHYAGLNPEANPGPYVYLQIEDSGAGIPPKILEKIFDPFFTTKEVGKGTGLGLSTSLAIIKSHGGFIRVYSEPGKGTKFTVYLPAQTEASDIAVAEIAVEIPRGNGELILVIDDEFFVRQITQQTLEAFGYRVVLAGDGAEAATVYASRGTEIAAVLMDMMMPVLDGPATILVLRKMNPAVRIIAASGLSANARDLGAASFGAKHFLSKPYTAETLLKALKQVLKDELPASSPPDVSS
jgi:PAS domain S-box-containing protein